MYMSPNRIIEGLVFTRTSKVFRMTRTICENFEYKWKLILNLLGLMSIPETAKTLPYVSKTSHNGYKYIITPKDSSQRLTTLSLQRIQNFKQLNFNESHSLYCRFTTEYDAFKPFFKVCAAKSV